MAYVIGEDCISCGTCAGECPVEAISEGAERYVIDADACTECGTCASVCPSEAISRGSSERERLFYFHLFLYYYGEKTHFFPEKFLCLKEIVYLCTRFSA